MRRTSGTGYACALLTLAIVSTAGSSANAQFLNITNPPNQTDPNGVMFAAGTQVNVMATVGAHTSTIVSTRVTFYICSVSQNGVWNVVTQFGQQGFPGDPGTLFQQNINLPAIPAGTTAPIAMSVEAIGTNGMPISGGQNTHFFYIRNSNRPPGMP